MQAGKVVGHLAQVVVGQVVDHVDHHRIGATAFAEIHQLVVQVAGRLAGDARVIAVAGRPVPVRRGSRCRPWCAGPWCRGPLRPARPAAAMARTRENRLRAAAASDRFMRHDSQAQVLPGPSPVPKIARFSHGGQPRRRLRQGEFASGKLEKYTGKLCKIHDAASPIRYAHAGKDCVINLLWPYAVLGTTLAQQLAATPDCPLQ